MYRLENNNFLHQNIVNFFYQNYIVELSFVRYNVKIYCTQMTENFILNKLQFLMNKMGLRNINTSPLWPWPTDLPSDRYHWCSSAQLWIIEPSLKLMRLSFLDIPTCAKQCAPPFTKPRMIIITYRTCLRLSVFHFDPQSKEQCYVSRVWDGFYDFTLSFQVLLMYNHHINKSYHIFVSKFSPNIYWILMHGL